MEKFENINLDREMYSQGNLSDVLEKLDPSENYIGTPLEGLDAFGRQLKRFDIKVSGPNSDTVEKFFRQVTHLYFFLSLFGGVSCWVRMHMMCYLKLWQLQPNLVDLIIVQ